jgi:hypothetical protein
MLCCKLPVSRPSERKKEKLNLGVTIMQENNQEGQQGEGVWIYLADDDEPAVVLGVVLGRLLSLPP